MWQWLKTGTIALFQPWVFSKEKIIFECVKLQDAIDTYGYESAIIVLCGNRGWTLKEYYLSDKFTDKLKLIAKDVIIMTEEQKGIKLKNKPVFSVQYHPESNPGPQDSVYLFQEFINNMVKNAKKKRS